MDQSPSETIRFAPAGVSDELISGLALQHQLDLVDMQLCDFHDYTPLLALPLRNASFRGGLIQDKDVQTFLESLRVSESLLIQCEFVLENAPLLLDRVPAKNLALLSHFPNLAAFTLNRDALETLELRECQLGEADAHVLAACSKLARLTLHWTSMSEDKECARDVRARRMLGVLLDPVITPRLRGGF